MIKKLSYILLAFIFASNIAFGQTESYYKQKYSGLNTRLNPKLLTDDESPDMSNFVLTETGSITERDVFGKYNTSSGILGSNPINGLFKYYTTTDKHFIACAGSKVAVGAFGQFLTDITPTANTVSAGSFWSAATFNNELYMVNRDVPLQLYAAGAGEGLNSPESRPSANCEYIVSHKNRLWAAASYVLYYSNLSNGKDWSTSGYAGYINLPDLTAQITGLVSYGGFLYVYTENDIYIVSGATPSAFAMVKSNSDVGCIAPRSIKITDSGIAFLSRTGVFIFNGTKSYKISDDIEPDMNNINSTLIKNACALWDGQSRYWLAYTDKNSTYNNKVVVYDTILKKWFRLGDLYINYFCRADAGTDKGELYGGSSLNDGTIWLLQNAIGTETITHDSLTDFATCITGNTVLWGSEVNPQVNLKIDDITTDDILVLPFEGDSGATTTTDWSQTGHTVTFESGAHIDVGDYKRGYSSCYFDGTNDCLSMPNSTEWDIQLDSSDWTIDLWVKFVTVSTQQRIVTHWESDGNQWYMLYSNGLYFDLAGAANSLGPTAALSTNTWYHVALVKQGTNYGLYIDGEQKDYLSDAGVRDYDGVLYFGKSGNDQSFFNGWLDNFRLSHRNVFDAHPNAGNTDVFDIPKHVSNGTLTSDNININAAAVDNLGTISWGELLPTYSNIQFTTRTGATDDTVYYNNWETWISTSTVLFNATDSTVWETNDEMNFNIVQSEDIQLRDILYYETDDNVSPETVRFNVSDNTASYQDYGFTTIPSTDLSAYEWIGYWLMSPITGSSVCLGIGEVSGTVVAYSTPNVVEPNTWEYHYWPIDTYADADINAVTYLQLQYMGTVKGEIYLGDMYAYDFLDNDEAITSTPNDFIQYKTILGTTDSSDSPRLLRTTIEYTPVLSASETTVESHYKTKYLDFGKPMLDKQFTDLYIEAYANDYPSPIYVDYDVDDGEFTGTFTYPLNVTGKTVQLKNYFPASVFGKTIQLNFRNEDRDSTIRIRANEIRFTSESL